jgi:hypothetical protein
MYIYIYIYIYISVFKWLFAGWNSLDVHYTEKFVSDNSRENLAPQFPFKAQSL